MMPRSAISTSPKAGRAPRIAMVLSGWPRISETFAINELLALRRAGMLAAVFATKAGDTRLCQPDWDVLDPLVEVLPDLDAGAQAAVVAGRVRGAGVSAVHGYFAHRPTTVAVAAAGHLGVPYGFSVHALDVRKIGAEQLRQRATNAAVVVACNREAAEAVRSAGTAPALVGHGVDLDRFSPSPPPDRPFISLLAVGRLVEKKGFHDLVEALALFDRPFHLNVVGEGPEHPRLEQMIAVHGLGQRVTLLGRRTHAQLPALYAAADVVVVPSVVDRTGDRDGLPNVVLEAMASQRPVVASDLAAIPTAVREGVNGLLVPPRQPGALADALTRLADDRRLRHRLGVRGRADVEGRFDVRRCGWELCRALERAYG